MGGPGQGSTAGVRPKVAGGKRLVGVRAVAPDEVKPAAPAAQWQRTADAAGAGARGELRGGLRTSVRSAPGGRDEAGRLPARRPQSRGVSAGARACLPPPVSPEGEQLLSQPAQLTEAPPADRRANACPAPGTSRLGHPFQVRLPRGPGTGNAMVGGCPESPPVPSVPVAGHRSRRLCTPSSQTLPRVGLGEARGD